MMRLVRVELPLAIMLGLAGSTSAFLQRVRPTHFMIPAHKYQAILRRSHVPARAFRSMRVMSATVEADMDDVAIASPPAEPAEAAGAPEVTGEEVEVDDLASVIGEPDDLDQILGEDDLEPAVQIPMDSIIIGEEYEGVVNNVVSYGAFVDIGTEVNGLVHISQLADEFVANCDDFIKEGDTDVPHECCGLRCVDVAPNVFESQVRVRVLNLDADARKLVLSMRQKPRNPVSTQGDVTKYRTMFSEDPAQFMTATVENIVSYGAFFALDDGCSGFVHISQMSPPGEHVDEVSDVLSVGQTVSVRIREIDEKLGRINLSLLPLSDDDSSTRSVPKEKDVSHLVGVDPNVFRKGVVSAVADYGLFVEIEGVDGLLHVSKISVDRSVTSENIRDKFEVGQEVEVRVLEANPETNKMSLSMVADDAKFDYASFLDIPPSEWLNGKVVSLVDYGAFIRLPQGVDGMVHISQMGTQGQRVASVYEELQIGQDVRIRIIEVDAPKQKLRLTMREPEFDDVMGDSDGMSVDRAPRRKTNSVEAYLNIPPDEWISGTVASITNFGAFIAVDADTDGLCHISQIAEEHVSNVDDYLEVGQNVQIRVIEVDVDNGRLGLSMREPRASMPRSPGRGPKKDVSYLLGRDPEEFIAGKVVSIVPYGAFVNIEGDVDGLVHISELAVGRVDTVEDVLQMGQEVQVRITEVNPDNNTVNLSMVPADQAQSRRGGRGMQGGDDFGGSDGDGYGRSRRSRGGSRRDGFDNSASFEREDFGGRSSGAAPTNSDDGADWQYFLNDYFDEKATVPEEEEE